MQPVHDDDATVDQSLPPAPPPPAPLRPLKDLLPTPATVKRAPVGLPAALGRYRVQEDIARGGMGRIVRVFDEQFERSMAMKVFSPDESCKLSAADLADLEQRFEREANLTGKMQHPGIPPVQEKGRLEDGRPYFIMKLVKGKILRSRQSESAAPGPGGGSTDALSSPGPDGAPGLIDIFQNICDTLAYAHSCGILHRDLKPSNIMVGAFGEVQVMDWGLAKLLGTDGPEAAPQGPDGSQGPDAPHFSKPSPDSQETLPGSVMGTPSFLAPEQARGEIRSLDLRCDVFGLGGILCSILTGRPPFDADTVLANHRLAMQGDLAGAFERLDRSGADADLIRLAKHCLAPNKEERPADAAAVAASVRRHLAAVQERLRQAQVERRAAEVRAAEERKRRQVAFRLSGVIVLLMVFLAGAYWWVTQARQARLEQERRSQQVARDRIEELGNHLGAGRIREAGVALEQARQSLDAINAPDLRAQLAQARTDYRMLLELDRLFAKRWQIVERQVIHHVEAARSGMMPVKASPGLILTELVPGVNKKELPQEYAAAYKNYGLPLADAAMPDFLEKLRASRIRQSLIDGLNLWFLAEPESKTLLAALKAADPARDALRQVLADPAAARPGEDELTELAKTDHDFVQVLFVSELLPADRSLELLTRAARRGSGNDRLQTMLAYRELLGNQPADALSHARAASALQPLSTAARLMVALALHKDGKTEEAVAEARLALEVDPNNADTFTFLAAVSNNSLRWDEGCRWADKALALEPHNAYAHHLLGHALVQKGRYDQAISHLRRAMELDPDDVAAELHLAMAHAHKKEYDQASAHIEKCLQRAPKMARCHHHLGEFCVIKGDWQQASRHFADAVKLEPGVQAYHIALIASLLELKRPADALAALERLQQIPMSANDQLILGAILAAGKRYDEAIAVLMKSLKTAPHNPNTYNTLGWALTEKGRLEDAAHALRQALKLDEAHFAAHSNLGVVLLHKKKFAEAIGEFQLAIQYEPNYAQAYAGLGVAYNEKGLFDKAVPCLEKALKLNPRLVPAHVNLSWACNARELYDQAIAHANAALKLDPRNAQALNNLGFAYLRQRSFDKAISQFEAAIAGDAKYAKPYINLAMICNEKGLYDKAIHYLEEANRLEPDNAGIYNELGFSFLRKNMLGQAIAQFELAVRHDPKHFLAHHNLGVCCNEKKEYDKAIGYFEQAIRINARVANPHNGMGLAYDGKGQLAKAIPCFARAAELAPGLVAPRLNLANDHAFLGQYDQSIVHYQKVIELAPKNTVALRGLAWSHFHRGEDDKGMAFARQFLDIEPASPIVCAELARALLRADRLPQALDLVKKTLALVSKKAPEPAALRELRDDLEAMLLLQPGLQDIVELRTTPRDDRERLLFGRLCAAKGHFESAVHITEPIFLGARPRATSLEFAQWCMRAAEGQGTKPPPLAQRADYRAKGLEALRRHLQACRDRLAADAKSLKSVKNDLFLLLQHRDFASVRPPALAQLPIEERNPWQSFWDAVDGLLKK